MNAQHTQGKLEVKELRTMEGRNIRYKVEPLGIEFFKAIDGSGRKDIYPDGVIRTIEQAKADAERVALCWNCHDELLAALESLANAYTETLAEEYSKPESDCPELVAARAAIAKARGQA